MAQTFRNIEKIKKIRFFLLLSISFFLPFYKTIVPPLIILWTVTSIFELSVANYKSNKHKFLFYSLLGYFGLSLISLLWTTNLYIGLKEIEASLSFIIFPLIFILSPKQTDKEHTLTLKSFIIGNLIIIIIQLIRASYLTIFDPNQLAVQDALFYFTYLRFSFMHPSYASMFALFSTLSILYLVLKFKESTKWIYLLIVFIPSIFLYSSKAGLLTFFTITIFSIIYTIIKYKKLITAIISIIILIILGIVIYKNDRIQTLINDRKINFRESENTIKTDTRIIIWQSNIELIKKNPLLGTGIGDYKNEINKEYAKINFQKAIDRGFDSHNEYLKSFAVLGIFGLINLLLILSSSFYYSVKEKNMYTFLFSVIVSINFLFESMFIKEIGIVFILFVFSFLYFSYDGQKTTEPCQKDK